MAAPYLARGLALLTAAQRNPVLIKEVRTRMRGWRTFLVMTLHLGLLAILLLLAYLTFSSSLSANTNLDDRRTFGKLLFGLIIGLELAMLAFTAPALTAGAIANERERQTYDLVRVTLLRPAGLVLGKFLAGLSFVSLLLFTALPMLSPAFIIGGVTLPEILISILCLLMTAIAFCAVGLFVSSLTARTLWATVLAYGYAVLQIFGLPLIYLFTLVLGSAALTTPSIEHASRFFVALLSLVILLAVSLNPGSALIASEVAYLNDHSLWWINIPIYNQFQVWIISPWVIYVASTLLFSLLMLWLTIRRVQRMES